MPLLKDLSCSIELSDHKEPLQELGTVYGDFIVETFIPVPKKQQTFTVHLSSRNFIAPGIAMYVFIDGIYQCNRNRQDLKLRRPPDHRSLVDFKVRQKEEMQKDGSMIAREWTFEKLDHAPADGAVDSCPPNTLENIGCIEVVVLRCAGTRNAKTTNMNLDGAADCSDYGSDRHSRSRTIAYDDRDPFANTNSNKHGSLQPGPSYRSPYVDTVRSREHSKRGHSRYSEPVSPGTQRGIPAPAFQYGSGPLPPRSRAETYNELLSEVLPDSMSRAAPTIGPNMLEKIVADAVKRGVEEVRKNDRGQTGSQQYEDAMEDFSQIPGAWPPSPRQLSKHRSRRSAPGHHSQSRDPDDRDLTWEQRSKAKRRHSSRSRAGARVAWEEPGWDEQSGVNGWSSPDDYENSWDTETWSKKRPESWEEVSRRSKSRTRPIRDISPARASYVSDRISERRRSKHDYSDKAPSRSHFHWDDAARSSSGDNDGWTRIEAPSISSMSDDRSNSTLKPSHSRSQVRPRRLSEVIENTLYDARPPSILVTNAPSISARSRRYPVDVRPRKPSAYSYPAALISAPPPTWGCASEQPRKNNAATTYLPPAPFSAIAGDAQESRCSSLWGSRKGWKDQSEGKDVMQEMQEMQESWGGDRQSDKARSIWEDKGADWNEQANDWGEAKVKQNGDDWDFEKDNNGWSNCNTSEKATVDTKDAAIGGWNDGFNTAPPSMPLLKITPAAARKKRVHHQVLAGRGTPYGHAISRPLYMDSLEKPYAVFRFKYRERSMLRGMFGEEKSGPGEKTGGKETLEALKRGVLGARLRALRVGRAEEDDVRRGTGWTEKWVRDHSRGTGKTAWAEELNLENVEW